MKNLFLLILAFNCHAAFYFDGIYLAYQGQEKVINRISSKNIFEIEELLPSNQNGLEQAAYRYLRYIILSGNGANDITFSHMMIIKLDVDYSEELKKLGGNDFLAHFTPILSQFYFPARKTAVAVGKPAEAIDTTQRALPQGPKYFPRPLLPNPVIPSNKDDKKQTTAIPILAAAVQNQLQVPKQALVFPEEMVRDQVAALRPMPVPVLQKQLPPPKQTLALPAPVTGALTTTSQGDRYTQSMRSGDKYSFWKAAQGGGTYKSYHRGRDQYGKPLAVLMVRNNTLASLDESTSIELEVLRAARGQVGLVQLIDTANGEIVESLVRIPVVLIYEEQYIPAPNLQLDGSHRYKLGQEVQRLSMANSSFQGLEWLHRNGWIHTDIKPENLLIKIRSDGRLEIVLADFGLAEKDSQLSKRSIGGTPFWNSPEVFMGEHVKTLTLALKIEFGITDTQKTYTDFSTGVAHDTYALGTSLAEIFNKGTQGLNLFLRGKRLYRETKDCVHIPTLQNALESYAKDIRTMHDNPLSGKTGVALRETLNPRKEQRPSPRKVLEDLRS